MNTLVALAEQHRANIRRGPFFAALSAGDLDHLRWVHQLRHQSRRFTQALSLRSALCREERFLNIFAAHAVEEGRHPEQLETWMRRREMSLAPVPPTRETEQLTDYCTFIAQHGGPVAQVLVLNVLSEGVALDFYTAALDRFGRGKLNGPYWHVHREVDEIHQAMGVDLCRVEDGLRAEYAGAIDCAADLYDNMLTSWALS
jgi:Iron-containing redox enzyme